MNAGRGDLLQKAQDAEQLALQGQVRGSRRPVVAPQPGVFEGGGPGAGGVPDLGALAAAPNGARCGRPAIWSGHRWRSATRRHHPAWRRAARRVAARRYAIPR